MAEVDFSSLGSNSNRSRGEREKMKPVVDAKDVVTKKKGVGKKIAENFIKEDISEIKDAIIFDWVLPGIKNMILNTLSMMFFNEPIDTRDRRRPGGSRVDYGSYSRSSNTSRERQNESRYREDDEIDYRDIVLTNRGAAEDVMYRLQDEIRDNGAASIAQLLELVQLPSNYTDCSWGWTDERDIGIQRVKDGFLIKVRQARRID